MFVETFAGSLEVILGYFIIVPLIVRLVSSASNFGNIYVMLIFPRFLGYSLVMTN